ncbi:hypothetical protein JK386_17315 [Nocardioides sp. zg-536]|uniref:Uncharacterized protein n=1 Tax=Nocardioides faecalis TaxID=2803858 RepID=A0A938Y9I2_9ACTN|nr:hypothetical protein [Nocardioides faecalis]MBM9461662.1 hypothetical protein [Nocardioides faecalis]MBS4754587.1 hypothetical protein [Nocardioides faecalis]QVI59930.1 hypothetical protein KG111_06350 [Nocardioides faecalis]
MVGQRGVAHVWVRQRHGPERWPGLVITWDKAADGTWSALVTYRRGHEFVTEWVERERLTPVPWRPHTGTAYG